MSKVTLLGPGPLAVGSRVKIKQPRLPVAVWTVDRLEPGSSFSWINHSVGLTSFADHRLSTIDNGTQVVLSFRQSGVLAPLMALIAGNLARGYVRTEAAGLKRHCE